MSLPAEVDPIDTARQFAPGVEKLLYAPENERLEFVTSEFYFPTLQSTIVMDRLESTLRSSARSRMEHVLILGARNTGKSLLLTAFSKSHPKVQHPELEADVVPVVLVEIDNANEDRFFDLILDYFGVGFEGLTVNRKLRTVRSLLNACGCRTLIVDEVYRTTSSNFRTRQQFFNTLLQMASLLKLTLVLVGADAEHAISFDEQLGSRFKNNVLRMRPWDYSGEWLDLLDMYEAYLPLRRPSNLSGTDDDQTISLWLHERSDGYIGDVHNILRLAAQCAIQTGAERITTDLLSSLNIRPLRQRDFG